MPKLYLIAALALALVSCDALTKPTASSLKGTYLYVGRRKPFQAIDKFELTGTKFVANTFFGESAMDYEVEDGYIYIADVGTKYRFKIVSPDTLRAEVHSPFEGTYVKASQ